ncbi:energy transducer TonB [Pseudomonas fluorescens]|uniref:TonB C-terminal domain-containing protein n=1 Tax=Pseudomonas fluorescens TaxID=294 RepID=A0A5E7EP71_PSEFL|nr:energy transducer TonB [Pseudomonas fluorescens]VVO28971.1 hypothetical protein PS723_04829 [Pseudomonas fluorescens]
MQCWLGLVIGFFIFIDSVAAEVFLIPEHTPKPDYPRELFRKGVTGVVRVAFTANADGSVSKVKTLENPHPQLAEVALAAVSQWRFRLWTVDSDNPAEVEVVAPMDFRLDLDLPIHFNKSIKKWKCRDLNEAALQYPESSWVDMPAFHYTRAHLSNVFYSTQLPDAERLALIARLNRSVPYIVRHCSTSPTSRYVRFLPEEIRKLL